MRRRVIFLVVLALLPALWLARGAADSAKTQAGADATATTQAGAATQTGAAAAAPDAGRFVPVDVYVDAGAKHLAAYQFEVTAKDAEIVGLEGGASKAFAQAYYDPAALQGNRIIVAAFSTGDDLPTGNTRVARLHFLATGNTDPATNLPAMSSKLVVATDAAGQAIDAKLTLRAYQGETR